MKPDLVGKNKASAKQKLKTHSEKKMISVSSSISSSSTSSNSPTSSPGLYNEKNVRGAENAERVDIFVDTKIKENKVDISDLAENCVLEEVLQFELPNIYERSRHEVEQLQHNSYPLAITINPGLQLTLEEEFRIHELDAMKENFLDGCFKSIIQEIPLFPKLFAFGLIGLSQDNHPSFASTALMPRQNKIKDVIKNLLNAGSFHKLLDCFYIFKDVQEKVKLETFKFSLIAAHLCLR